MHAFDSCAQLFFQSYASQAADSSTAAVSSLPLIHDAITELARLHWPFFPGVSMLLNAS